MLPRVSNPLSQNGFLRPPDEASAEPTKRRPLSEAKSKLSYKPQRISRSKVRFSLPREASEDHTQDPNRRRANVYDACAGRVNSRGFNTEAPTVASTRDTKSSGLRDLHPEQIIYRRLAQHRDAEHMKQYIDEDTYFAHEKLSANHPLPRSDLLESIHAYTSDLYKHQAKKRGKLDHHSMDESALLAIGILTEELAREQLGATGDMVLVEGQSSSEDEGETSDGTYPAISRRKKRARAMTVDGPISQHHQYLQGVRQKHKRRRIKRTGAESSGHDTNTERRDNDFEDG